MPHPLDQSGMWANREGLSIQVSTMSSAYALNAYRMMERNALAIALKYSIYLGTISRPSEDTVAFDLVEAEINSEIDRMQADPVEWLRGKPLMKALADRFSDTPAVDPRHAPNEAAEARGEFTLPWLDRKPVAPGVPADVNSPGDEQLVFLVVSSDPEDCEVKAAFVGNRRAALQFINEHNRYATHFPVQLGWVKDHAGGGGGVRVYPAVYTEVQYATLLDAETGEVLNSWSTIVGVVADGGSPEIKSENNLLTQPRFRPDRVQITTNGPEYQLDEVEWAHRYRIVNTQASIRKIEGDK